MLTRIITGVIGIAAFAYVIQLGGEVFAAGGAVLALLAWFEFSRAFDQSRICTFALLRISIIYIEPHQFFLNSLRILQVAS